MPPIPVAKTLFALSGNVCAYDGCEEKLTDPSWTTVKADIAHICGDRPGAQRFDPSMTDAERDSFDNLILLCPNHHRMIDGLEPERHTVEMLREMKQRHESRWERAWASEDALWRFAALAVSPPTPEAQGQAHPPTISTGGVPRLVAELAELGSGDGVEVVNTGDADAYGIGLEPLPGMDNVWVARTSTPSRMSPGARWLAGSLSLSLADVGPYVVRLTWRDASGQAFDGEFPLG
jgi:hypothetical protein